MQVNEQVYIYHYMQPIIWDKSKLISLINLFWTIWKKFWHVFHSPHIVIIYWSYLSWTSMKPIMNIIIHKKKTSIFVLDIYSTSLRYQNVKIYQILIPIKQTWALLPCHEVYTYCNVCPSYDDLGLFTHQKRVETQMVDTKVHPALPGDVVLPKTARVLYPW